MNHASPHRPLPTLLRRAALACMLSAVAVAVAVAAAAPANIVDINLVGLNDFHGNLEASKFTYTSVSDQQARTIVAGGIDTLGAALQAWRKEDKELLLVGAGDLLGASPAMSSMWADEPAIGALNLLGLRVTSVGNHEFDAGPSELLRLQSGGCASPRADQACHYAPRYDGAKFHYLGANVVDQASGKPFMPAYRIEQAHGVKIAFIGTVLKNIAAVTVPSAIGGLEFGDEADAVNRVLPELRKQGVGVFVVLIHEGGSTDEHFDQPDCANLKGDIVKVVKRLDPAIRLVISGHSHQGYTCRVDGRVVTQAEMGGHVLSRIKLSVDAATKTVRDVSAQNVVMVPGAYPADPVLGTYLKNVQLRSAAALARPVGHLAVASVKRDKSAAGASPLGELVAASGLAATRKLGVQVVFVNSGGIRRDLESGPERTVSYGQAQAVLPFGNTLIAMSMTGAQIRALLEQQWPKDTAGNDNLLQASDNIAYRWDASQPKGQRVVAGSVTLDGAPLDDAKTYRVAANNFLAGGGDKFDAFAGATDKRDTGVRDLDALIAYLGSSERAGQPAGSASASDRIQRVK